MNWRHFQAFVWLRWRLSVNQWRRSGAINSVLMIIISIVAVLTAIPLFVGSFVLGTYLIPKATPAQLMYAWDAVSVAFLFFWSIGLLAELQRSESLSLSKFLHLPVSANGAFLINYLSSLLRLSLIVFGPVMLGFSLALIYVKGIALLPVLPLLGAFLLMVTALTYQFQGWLASLMSNPRRRRTMIVVTTMLFVLLCQLPNLINFSSPWGVQKRVNQSKALAAEMKKLERDFRANAFDPSEYERRQKEVQEKHQLATRQALSANQEYWQNTARLANMILPIGWLPLGVMSAAEGGFVPWILGLLGMTLIGTASLRRAYHATVGRYQGRPTSRTPRPLPTAATAPVPAVSRERAGALLEARIPGLSEPVSAIALGGFRALLRSPEVKMALMTPLIMSVLFGSMMFNNRHGLPEMVRPLVAIGGIGCVLLGVLQLAGNQFGFDRDGFRVFVLCSAPRRDILFGKSLAYAPFALGMGLIVLVAVQVLCPMRVDHFLAMFPQLLSMFILFSLFTNISSIYAPFHLRAGSLQPSNLKIGTALMQVLMFVILFPLPQALTLVPLGAEFVLEFLGWTNGVPIYLLLSLAECAAVVLLYRLILEWQGTLFQAREQAILEIVTGRGA